jgi:hypothetical protein
MNQKNQATTMRQSALVVGSGPGSLTVMKDGRTALMPGVDSWYVSQKLRYQTIPVDAKVYDKALAEALHVKYFVSPPAEGATETEGLVDGVLGVTLFPKWTVCTSARCGAMFRLSSSDLNLLRCTVCQAKSKGKGWKRVQTNFVVACEDGHLDEFPWSEWVHKGTDSVCGHDTLRFSAKGIVELGKQSVRCTCGKSRSLSGTNELSEDGSTLLSAKLSANGEPFLCRGSKPWLHIAESKCGKPIRMILRNQSNLYFASTVSSILIPEAKRLDSPIVELIETSNFLGKYKAWAQQGKTYSNIAMVAQTEDSRLEDYPLALLEKALEAVIDDVLPDGEGLPVEEGVEFDRNPEWEALKKPVESKNLVVREYGWKDGDFFGISSVLGVPLLKKTTALQGFSRILPGSVGVSQGKQLLRRNPFLKNQSGWLPGVQHAGEGIFLAMDAKVLASWEGGVAVRKRMQPLADTFKEERSPHSFETFPKFVLLHTLSHLLIQQLVFQCGYTAASLGERIYAQGDQCGLLIYTASSSGDGTMGGLVEMAHPSRFKGVLEDALKASEWCSNDPICMQTGVTTHNSSGGNLAACYNCCLIPETACDHFNRGLDRALLTGDLGQDSSTIGLYSSMIGQ